ncbi:melanoregulin [Apodemus sylvaticus]|uniref:melanoregulin n=1 Tax=Apodemus sylvaticus TaxID=10129 RepID=UPI002243D1A9|nr:melanoregulin [Apodemus sylvaticus]
MGLRRWLRSACCCCPCPCLEEPARPEKEPLVRCVPDRLAEGVSAPIFISLQEWQRLNYDIYTLRQIRREVRNRWRRILEDLGFQREADSLLSVTKLSTMSDSKNTRKAREMLLKLAEETSIFPASWELSERYLLIVDRLIALDAAEDFFKIASQMYPKKPGVPCLVDGQRKVHYLPFPSP